MSSIRETGISIQVCETEPSFRISMSAKYLISRDYPSCFFDSFLEMELFGAKSWPDAPVRGPESRSKPNILGGWAACRSADQVGSGMRGPEPYNAARAVAAEAPKSFHSAILRAFNQIEKIR